MTKDRIIASAEYVRIARQISPFSVKLEGDHLVMYEASPPELLPSDSGGWAAITVIRACARTQGSAVIGTGSTPELALADMLSQYTKLGMTSVEFCASPRGSRHCHVRRDYS